MFTVHGCTRNPADCYRIGCCGNIKGKHHLPTNATPCSAHTPCFLHALVVRSSRKAYHIPSQLKKKHANTTSHPCTQSTVLSIRVSTAVGMPAAYAAMDIATPAHTCPHTFPNKLLHQLHTGSITLFCLACACINRPSRCASEEDCKPDTWIANLTTTASPPWCAVNTQTAHLTTGPRAVQLNHTPNSTLNSQAAALPRS